MNIAPCKAPLMASIMALVMLSGCLEDKGKPADEVVQTVDWYMAHDTERNEVKARCDNDPGTLGATPNCINASRAASKKVWGANGGIKFNLNK